MQIYGTFRIKDGLKEGGILLPLPSKFALEYAVRWVKSK
jgi:hypothetical protein